MWSSCRKHYSDMIMGIPQEGKTLVSADEMMGKVRRARAAADAAYHGESDHFIICARTN